MPETPDGLWYSRREAVNVLHPVWWTTDAVDLATAYLDLYSLVDDGSIGSTGHGFARMKFLRSDVDRIAATRREGG